TEPSGALLSKGLEEEVYTGLPDGHLVGLADEIARALPGFRTEPDRRNPEFALPPLRDYGELTASLVEHRAALRDWLGHRGGCTLIPGATMSTGDSSVFLIADPENDYYNHIRELYGTRVVTASAHISVGLGDDETILRAARVLRMEACLFLALTASSPFLDGAATGHHSTRWATFPISPDHVPVFESAEAYRTFVRTAVADGRMMNTRQLWISARPNGHAVPDDLNRVELRICDRIDDARLAVAVTGLVEARVWQILDDPSLDPLTVSELPLRTRAEDLLEITESNEAAVAAQSLDATLRDWRDGRPVAAREWLVRYCAEAVATARARGFATYLEPLRDVLDRGNTAMRWLALHARGMDVVDIIRRATAESTVADGELRLRTARRSTVPVTPHI
ncbi:MAG: glutamate--cysteine ligase, partial [Planctomycetota bacterium]